MTLTGRRGFLQAAGLCTAGLMLPDAVLAEEALWRTPRTSSNLLRYNVAAGAWVEALPVGNGRLGTMVFGRIAQERLQLNEDTLWAGSPYNPNNPQALTNLQTVRDLIDQGAYKKASDLSWKTLLARPVKQMPYGAAGDLLIDFIDAEAAIDYERTLDLSSAVARTIYRTSKGRYSRESFVSPIDQVIVLQLKADGKARLNFDLGYRHPREVSYGTEVYNGEVGANLFQGAAWDRREGVEREQRPSTLSLQADGEAALLVTGRNIESSGIPSGLSYAVRVRIVSDGTVTTGTDGLSVRDGRTATLYVSAATSYVDYRTVNGDPVARVRRDTEAAAAQTYARIRTAHVKSHRALFDRFDISLSGVAPARDAAAETTDQRITRSPDRDDPQLAALYLQFARYLMICSSREGTQPANLQGIWNEGVNPPWGSKYTININTEMNYWPAAPANLMSCMEPLLKLVEELTVNGAVTARSMYGARGWVAHHNTDLWRATAPIDGPLWGQWPMGGAWLCTTLWDYYDFGRDETVLKRLYAVMRGASLFFLDFLIEDRQGRGLVTSPSLSPENAHIKDAALCAGPAMDSQILRDLFDHTIEAHARLGVPVADAALIAALKAARTRLPADRIGKHGQLQEWLDDWDDRALDPQHRHVSHLYAVYPSSQLNVRDTPAFIEAAKVTLNSRGDLATGWGTAWRLCLWARMGDGERAYTILKGLLGPERTYPNMFDAHPPFQIDGNFGGAAGIMEMILQSWGGEIHVLPALPKAWPSGHVRGLRARGGITADLNWADHRLVRARFIGPAGSRLRLNHAGKSHSLTLNNRGYGEFKV